MTKITLDPVGSLIDVSTAQSTINDNFDIVETAMDNTLSRNGQAPNQMAASIDMNSNRVLNLPDPLSNQEPVTLSMFNTSVAGTGNVPGGGTTGQSLVKNSNTAFDTTWANRVSSVGLSLPADFTVTGSPVTLSGTLGATFANTPTGTGGFVRATSPTLVTPNLGVPSALTLTNATGLPVAGGGTGTTTLTTGAPLLGAGTSPIVAAGYTGGTIGLPLVSNSPAAATFSQIGIGAVSGLGTNVSTFLQTPTSANLAAALTDETGTGANVFATSPTITTPNIVGTTAAGNATAGSVGEYIESVIVSGSSVALTTNVAANITSISLTAGDWDVTSMLLFNPAATTSITVYGASTSLTSATLDSIYLWFERVNAVVPANPLGGFQVLTRRVNVSSTTTVFLVGFSTFTVSTNSAYGIIRARRIR